MYARIIDICRKPTMCCSRSSIRQFIDLNSLKNAYLRARYKYFQRVQDLTLVYDKI